MADTPFTWSGLYFGAQAGYGWGRTDHTYDNGALGRPTPAARSAAAYGGYNAQVGNSYSASRATSASRT